MIDRRYADRNTEKRSKHALLPVILLTLILLCGCAAGRDKEAITADKDATTADKELATSGETTEQTITEQTIVGESTNIATSEDADTSISDSALSEENVSETSLFLGKYDSFESWMERRQGSVGFITDRTLLLSVYLEEPDYHWTEEEIQVTNRVKKIAYSFLEKELKEKYNTEIQLLYDVEENPDLLFHMKVEENIPVYVTTEQEREIDDLEDAWIATLPVCELMEKYEADSVGFLFFVAHEGCSYSSMHFIDDGVKTWDESCLLYLRDMYSKTLEYETPAVYAHELLHLYGAEDLYTDADVFSKDTYKKAQEQFAGDLMINTYDVINGKYTIYSDSVRQVITPLTAYLIGVPGVEYPLEGTTELVKEEVGCFSGSTYDRPF